MVWDYWAGFKDCYLAVDPAWPLVVQKTSIKVVDQDMGSRCGGAIWGCRTGLKGFGGWWAVSSLGFLGQLFPQVHIKGFGP